MLALDGIAIIKLYQRQAIHEHYRRCLDSDTRLMFFYNGANAQDKDILPTTDIHRPTGVG